MTRILSATTFAALLFVGLAGCRSPLYSLVRGQSPDVQQAAYSQQHGDVQNQVVYANDGYGQCDCEQCRQERCGHSCRLFGCKGTTRDHLIYDFQPPQGIVYPQHNQPTGVVQYPYYTVKGPSDFFYTGK